MMTCTLELAGRRPHACNGKQRRTARDTIVALEKAALDSYYIGVKKRKQSLAEALLLFWLQSTTHTHTPHTPEASTGPLLSSTSAVSVTTKATQ